MLRFSSLTNLTVLSDVLGLFSLLGLFFILLFIVLTFVFVCLSGVFTVQVDVLLCLFVVFFLSLYHMFSCKERRPSWVPDGTFAWGEDGQSKWYTNTHLH